MTGRSPQRQGPPMANPAAFNRGARVQRHRCGSVVFGAGLSGQPLDLPQVGYHHRVIGFMALAMGAAVGSPTGRWLSGHFGGNTSRFPAPLGIIRKFEYALNSGSPIFSMDGYGAHLLYLANNRGLDPWSQVATSVVGRNRKERSLFCILNTTDGTLVTPDSLVTASKSYTLNASFVAHLSLGESAAAGLVPVQDIRIKPRVTFDFGSRSDVLSVAADFAAEPTGSVEVFCEYFTTPSPRLMPDTDWIKQSVMETQAIAATGEQVVRPQLGGVLLKMCQTIWNGSKAIDPTSVDNFILRVQQGQLLERVNPKFRILEERRNYGRLMPDECYVWDHTTGIGDPGIPSLRDRIQTANVTSLEYITEINASTSISATAELRTYKEQLLPLPRLT